MLRVRAPRHPGHPAERPSGTLPLPDPATVVVVGGGPAGSFFALRLLRGARRLGRSVHVTILEKKPEVCFYSPAAFCSWEGCNYCAGGISPRLADTLGDEGISLPDEVVEGRATELIVHGDWKSIELPVPEDRHLVSVFRGSRPKGREGRFDNFDAFLLRLAAAEGAEVITAEATHVRYSPTGRPVVSFRTPVDPQGQAAPRSLEADFAVFAPGVNSAGERQAKGAPLLSSLQELLPRFRPPRLRRAIIAEMEGDDVLLRPLEGEVHFIQHGSKELSIEMASLLPKDRWVTAVLLGKSVDRASPAEYLDILQRFVDLPHVSRLLPPGARLRIRCCCHPWMSVGAAEEPYGTRVAVTGDMAVSRLYKDGLYSAYVTTAALADCVLEEGVDREALARRYGRVIERFEGDNGYGRIIFFLSRWVFGHPALSRILYQAILIERKRTPRERRRLEQVLWRIASGDASYRSILAGMLHPTAVRRIISDGVLSTLRDRAAERLFGLDWNAVGRYSTGVGLEELERMRAHLFRLQGTEPPARAPEMERMFTIRIRAEREEIFRQLGAFGDPEREYFKPRFIRVERTAGRANEVGTTIRYDIRPLRPLSFEVELEKVVPGRYLLYDIKDGFGRGGIFAFDVEPLKPGVNLLSIYVGFDFRRGDHFLSRPGWWLVRRLFPQFAHDVLWNHSLCRIKQLAEQSAGRAAGD